MFIFEEKEEIIEEIKDNRKVIEKEVCILHSSYRGTIFQLLF